MSIKIVEWLVGKKKKNKFRINQEMVNTKFLPYIGVSFIDKKNYIFFIIKISNQTFLYD